MAAANIGGAAAGGLNGTWVLVAIDGKRPDFSRNQFVPSFTISKGEISGADGCTRFSGPVNAENPKSIMWAETPCAQGTVMLPLDFQDLPAHLRTATVDGNSLRLAAHGGRPASTYERQ
ncbi:MAG: META domain-containing protein [Alphaproteobacteria bacterium]|nr:META domain-containing protein [Alphaproteobacteria bacterium]